VDDGAIVGGIVAMFCPTVLFHPVCRIEEHVSVERVSARALIEQIEE